MHGAINGPGNISTFGELVQARDGAVVSVRRAVGLTLTFTASWFVGELGR